MLIKYLLSLSIFLFVPSTIAYEAPPKPVQVVQTTPEHVSLALAIKTHESGGNYTARGGSGEYGAYQFMSSTWDWLSKKHLGYVAEMTPGNQDHVAEAEIKEKLDEGYTVEQVALWWNSGGFTHRSGVNRHGVYYDTRAYVNKVLANL